MDTTDIRTEMDRVRADFRELVDSATVRDLRRPTNGTKWTNEQLLFHMVFGYVLVRNLLVLVRGFSRLPDEASRRFAVTLNAGTRPFHTINYLGSLGGIRVLGYARTERLMDRTIRTLQTSLDHSSDKRLFTARSEQKARNRSLSGTRRRTSSRSTPWCCPAVSPTATICGPAPSPASRR